MTKPTPGPWRLEADPYPDGIPYFRFKAGAGYFANSECPAGFGFHAIISEADARLIVAAPELLAALQEIMTKYTGNGDTEYYICKDAIAKALGPRRPTYGEIEFEKSAGYRDGSDFKRELE